MEKQWAAVGPTHWSWNPFNPYKRKQMACTLPSKQTAEKLRCLNRLSCNWLLRLYEEIICTELSASIHISAAIWKIGLFSRTRQSQQAKQRKVSW